MPLDNSAAATTATNSATYLANSRLWIFVPEELPSGSTPATGDAPAGARPWGAPGWRETLIQQSLAVKSGYSITSPARATIQSPRRHPRGETEGLRGQAFWQSSC